MDAEQYEKKMKELLEHPVYRKLKEDATPGTERKVLQEVRELEEKDHIPRNLAMRLKPSASKQLKLYGLPKIRKRQVPLYIK